MSIEMVNLLAGSVHIKGNEGDEHTLRIHNPTGVVVITPTNEFFAEFVNSGGKVTEVDVDISEIDDGTLLIPIVINSGEYRVYLVDPRRTIFTARIFAV